MDPHDPADQARTLYRENLWLRELLVRVAHDLEHVAVLEQYRPHTDRLLRLELGNGQKLIFDMGTGSAERLVSTLGHRAAAILPARCLSVTMTPLRG